MSYWAVAVCIFYILFLNLHQDTQNPTLALPAFSLLSLG